MREKANVQRIDFEEIKRCIEEISPVGKLERWELIPNSIYELALTQGTELPWKPIPQWSAFEQCTIDYTEKEFLDIVFSEHKPVGQMYFVTDSCFHTKTGYIFDASHLLTFVENITEIEEEYPFPQPLDYVFVNPHQRLLTLIHHDGLAVQHRTWI